MRLSDIDKQQQAPVKAVNSAVQGLRDVNMQTATYSGAWEQLWPCHFSKTPFTLRTAPYVDIRRRTL